MYSVSRNQHSHAVPFICHSIARQLQEVFLHADQPVIPSGSSTSKLKAICVLLAAGFEPSRCSSLPDWQGAGARRREPALAHMHGARARLCVAPLIGLPFCSLHCIHTP